MIVILQIIIDKVNTTQRTLTVTCDYTCDIEVTEADTSRDNVEQCDIADTLTVGDLKPSQLSTSSSDCFQTAITQPPAATQHHPLNRQTDGRCVAAQYPRQRPNTCQLFTK